VTDQLVAVEVTVDGQTIVLAAEDVRLIYKVKQVKDYRLRVLLRRLFRVRTIDGRYCITWVEDEAIAYRRWQWWNPKDWLRN
jgi:hypothetical protein